MSDIVSRLRGSIALNAINGDAHERAVCKQQMREAAYTIEQAERELAEARAELERMRAVVEAAREQNRRELMRQAEGQTPMDWAEAEAAFDFACMETNRRIRALDGEGKWMRRAR